MARQSQEWPATCSFLVPGLGQLMQGRLGSAIWWAICGATALASILITIGYLLFPIVCVLCALNAARWEPK